MSDDFYDLVGQEADIPRYRLCDRLIKDSNGERHRCQYLLSSQPGTWICDLCKTNHIALCDCGKADGTSMDAIWGAICDNRFDCPKKIGNT